MEVEGVRTKVSALGQEVLKGRRREARAGRQPETPGPTSLGAPFQLPDARQPGHYLGKRPANQIGQAGFMWCGNSSGFPHCLSSSIF